MKPTKIGTVVGIAAIAGALAVAPPAGATMLPSRHAANTAVPELSRVQIPLTKAAKVLRTEIERGQYAGYAGLELEDHQVVLWWKGKIPNRVMSAPRPGSSLRFGSAPPCTH